MEVYQLIEDKLDKIKEKINNIRKYSETSNSIVKSNEYMESLNRLSQQINIIEAMCEDIYEQYIVQINGNILSNEDKLLRKNLEINKKIQDIFLPYMLYLNIMLQNK